MVTSHQHVAHFTLCRRLGATMLFCCKQLLRPAPKASITFCIAHFNSPEFLDATLHSVRHFHPDARVIVADASSEWSEYLAAKSVCQRHHAELHPLASWHRHTGLLNYMFRQIRSRVAIFLDQDCVLLASLDPIVRLIESGKVLIGPRDEFQLSHPDFCVRFPKLAGQFLRNRPEFVHASLMVMDVSRVRRWSAKPFAWRAEWGAHPLERYYGLTELVRRHQSDGVLMLNATHTSYGFGQIYLFQDRPVAYHQWYSGRVFGKSSKMDEGFEADWFRAEMFRFIQDYRAGTLKFDLQ